jgi:uncharacterized protein (DUF1800 family)
MNNNILLPAAKVDTAPSQNSQSKQLRTSTTTAPYTGAWTQTQVAHLLKRTMFGATLADVNHMLTLTTAQAVDELLNTVTATPSPPLNNYGSGTNIDPDVAFGATWVNDTSEGNSAEARRDSLRAWWVNNMLTQGRSLEQKMTLFWHNHFSTQSDVYGDARYGYKHIEMLRTNALGNFQTLVNAVSIDCAMLKYLNGYANTVSAPDENYGREVQELFTQGKGVNSLYTQADVEAAARALTGWRITDSTVTSYFSSNKHDTNPKQFSSYYNNTVINDTTNGGQNELADFVTMLLATNECAEYICRCLYINFVYYDIDSTVQSLVIDPMAQALRNSNYDIKTVLSLLFNSEHFYDPLNMGCFIKCPIEHMVGTMRQWGAVFPTSGTNNSTLAAQYYMWDYIVNYANNAGQLILDPPNVAGWPAYYQSPEFHELWINSDSLPVRQQFTDQFINTGVTNGGQTVILDPLAFTTSMPTPDDPVALTTDVLALMLSVTVSSTVQNYLVSVLLSGQTNNAYWTSAWDAYAASPADVGLQTTVLNRLKPFYQYIMDLPEYQLQ